MRGGELVVMTSPDPFYHSFTHQVLTEPPPLLGNLLKPGDPRVSCGWKTWKAPTPMELIKETEIQVVPSTVKIMNTVWECNGGGSGGGGVHIRFHGLGSPPEQGTLVLQPN